MTDPSIQNPASELLEADLLVCLGTIEAFNDDTIRQSAKYWKAVETKLKIEFELKRCAKAASKKTSEDELQN